MGLYSEALLLFGLEAQLKRLVVTFEVSILM